MKCNPGLKWVNETHNLVSINPLNLLPSTNPIAIFRINFRLRARSLVVSDLHSETKGDQLESSC